MSRLIPNGSTSNILRFPLKNLQTGLPLTGLTSASTGLIISTACQNEATATAYTVAGSTIETIATLGTYAAPTATKCRFKEYDATNHPGLYEFQFTDARFAVSNAKQLVITVSGATNLLTADYEVDLNGVTVATNNDKTEYALTSAYDPAENAVTMNTSLGVESYAAAGDVPTFAQAIFQLISLFDIEIYDTTLTTCRLDGSTPATTYTLDDNTNPTSRHRAT